MMSTNKLWSTIVEWYDNSWYWPTNSYIIVSYNKMPWRISSYILTVGAWPATHKHPCIYMHIHTHARVHTHTHTLHQHVSNMVVNLKITIKFISLAIQSLYNITAGFFNLQPSLLINTIPEAILVFSNQSLHINICEATL